jgi:ubiquinone biosynthesis monooxygenase Coq7
VLRTLSPSPQTASTPSPSKAVDEKELTTEERKHAAGLMRINHTGEVCAQALYQGQALTAKLPDIRQEMEKAAEEEVDHLVWCHERLNELDSHTSLLNPLFYGLSFSMGAFAGAVSDKISLGFVAATEELVCNHLEKHLQELPENDQKSKQIVSQMLEDEARHQQTALDAGGARFPTPVKFGMKLLSKAMTKTTYHI